MFSFFQKKATPPPSGPTFAGYHLLGELGRGEHTVVHRARKPGGPEVALKVLSREAPPEASMRARREIQTLVGLDCPHVVRVRDFGIEADEDWSALELLEGGTLEGRRLSLQEGISVMLALLDVVHILHTDHRCALYRLEPRNVLFGADGKPRLTDFRFMRPLDAPHLTGERHDAASGQRDLGRLAADVLGQSGMPEPIAAVLRRMQDPDPGQRYPSVNEAREALAACAG